jgi:hypothetical protein
MTEQTEHAQAYCVSSVYCQFFKQNGEPTLNLTRPPSPRRLGLAGLGNPI